MRDESSAQPRESSKAMNLIARALWRRLDVPGHDAAELFRTDAGWRLCGTAVFRHAGSPACLAYTLDMDADWATREGKVHGFAADRWISHHVIRRPVGWALDGVSVPGLDHLVDLDLGFTPATNLQQLRRVSIEIGQCVELPVAWLDVNADDLVALAQRYERLGEATYWYEAPSVPYSAELRLARCGFVHSYPGLWISEIEL